MKREEVKCTNCGCRCFWRQRTMETMVDFGRPAVTVFNEIRENTPTIEGAEVESVIRYWCAECSTYAGYEKAGEMEALLE